MRWLLALLVAVLLSASAAMADDAAEREHWSAEFKGGTFYPAIDNWATYYGSDRTPVLAGSLGYRIIRQIEAGVEAAYLRDTGTGYAPVHGIATGTVKYDAAPLNLFVLFRGEFANNQWIVPYAGGGFTRMYYRQRIENQAAVRGSTNGYHGRAGIQFLLDGLDSSASSNLFHEYGITHTYFIIEAETVRAMADTVTSTGAAGERVDLGGTTYWAGFLFAF